MAELIEWSEVITTANAQPSSGIRHLNLLDGEVHTVRFVGNPVRYFAYIVNGKLAICGDPASCPVRAKYHLDPIRRYAANVLDRDESVPEHQLKTVELNPSILRPVAAWARATKIDPGGNGGCDFSIEAQGKGTQRRYQISTLGATPFSEDEKQYIMANLYDLLKLYPPVPPDKIEELLFGKQH